VLPARNARGGLEAVLKGASCAASRHSGAPGKRAPLRYFRWPGAFRAAADAGKSPKGRKSDAEAAFLHRKT